ncbi:MAG: 1,4-dihydroxy-2-naphthoate octaprenyltransferase [Verrucomicrobiota bacterium]|nr:1,4-dihydroxy-2-naphthoate octaprenyltransferase [Verrucomicrobiota bacterium]
MDDESLFFPALLAATRPKTLMAAVLPVSLGATLAYSINESFNYILFTAVILSALCIQIATNLFNDVIDAKKGADTDQRIGPKRMTSSGTLPPQSLIIAGITFCFMAVTFSLPLIVTRGIPIVIIGVISLFLAYGYTGGPWPLAYKGLGEIFVFIFFGLVAVNGTFYVFTGQICNESILLGTQSGLLCAIIISINNARDITQDRNCGKMTLAARYGIKFAKREILILSILPYLLGLIWMPLGHNFTALIPLMGMPLSAIIAILIIRNEPSSSYNKYLGLSVLAYLNFSVLVGVGLQLK